MTVASQASAETVISLPPGSHGVGFRIVQQYDRSREFRRPTDPVTGEAVKTERARPIQTLIWYPAKRGGAPLHYADYMATRLTEADFGLTPAQLTAGRAGQARALSRRAGAGSQAILESSVLAARDAPTADGDFPVVVYAPGAGGTADENADLFEYLASHGYIIIASTNLGAHEKAVDYSMAGTEPQIADIEFLVGLVQALPHADKKRIAVLGWSWGGMNNVFAAARDSRISALISLDGTREPAFTRQIDVRRLTAPWLYFARTPDTVPQITRSEIDTTFSLLNEAKYADVYQLTMYPMQHIDFVSSRQHETAASSYGEFSKAEVRQAYNMVSLYVRNFLDAYLKQDPAGRALLGRKPVENGAAPHTIIAETRLSQGAPASQEQLAVDLARDGFGRAVDAYRAAQQRDASFTLSERTLKTWGYALLGRGRAADASAIFGLWTVLYPRDWDAFDSLGEAHEIAGNRAPAIEAYQRSLALNPGNGNAADHLKTLNALRP